MFLKAPKLLLLFFCLFSLSGHGQSKKELKVKISILESQVAQMRSEKKELSMENKQMKEQQQENFEEAALKATDLCDSVMLRNTNLEAEIKLLQDQLFYKRLSWAKDSLHPNFKKKNYLIHKPEIRKGMMEEYQKSYLSQCLRLKTSHRLFSEQIVLEYEMNPVNGTFAGYVRHQYIPDMGADEYNFQEIRGYFTAGEKGGVILHITDLDSKPVEIMLRHHPRKSIYNKISGEKEDLEAIKTKVVAIEEFYFSECKK
jgi:hypothetical protein